MYSNTHRHLARPERQVVAQQLHNERAVLVAVLAQGVEVADGLIKRLRVAQVKSSKAGHPFAPAATHDSQGKAHYLVTHKVGND
jgi:hypothetical protein